MGKEEESDSVLQAEQCVLIQLLNHVLPFFCACNGRGEDRISAKKYKIFADIRSSSETKAT